MPLRTRMLVIAFLLVCTFFGAFITLISIWRQDVVLTRRLEKQEQIYQALQDKYISIRSDTDKLQTDSEYQGRVLKEEFGYVEKNDVPVVVVGPDDAGSPSKKK